MSYKIYFNDNISNIKFAKCSLKHYENILNRTKLLEIFCYRIKT